MKAVVMEAFGGPDVLRFVDVARPAVGPDDVLIAVRAVSVNRTLDIALRSGNYTRLPPLPHVLGADPAGVVVEVGAAVESRKLGDRVIAATLIRPGSATAPPVMLGVDIWGGYADYVRVPAGATTLIPDGVDFSTATIVGRHAPMALHLLEAKAGLRGGETVLVMGAAGGLGSAGVQVAKLLGATVIAGAGSDDRVAAGLAAGARHGINYRRDDLAQELNHITGGRGVDVVFENIGDPELFPRALASLARGGRLVTAGSHGGGIVPLDITRLYQRQLTVIGSTGQSRQDTERCLAWAATDALRGDAAASLPLEQAADAHRSLETGDIAGKILLLPSGES